MYQHGIYGIIGLPLGHSRSPALHTWAFHVLDHRGIFASWPVFPSELPDFVRAVRLLRIQGVCVTIPHKEAIIPLLDGISERAAQIGAVNTLYWHEGKLYGENTDVDGFLFPLQKRPPAHTALILGAGGAARAVIVGLQSLGVQEIFITNRNAARAHVLAREFSLHAVAWDARASVHASWVINTTPLGMDGQFKDVNPYPQAAFSQDFSQKGGLAYDLVYNPLKTCFLKEAHIAGWQMQDGLDMFVEQARCQMRLWTEKSTDFAATRACVEQSLGVAVKDYAFL